MLLSACIRCVFVHTTAMNCARVTEKMFSKVWTWSWVFSTGHRAGSFVIVVLIAAPTIDYSITPNAEYIISFNPLQIEWADRVYVVPVLVFLQNKTPQSHQGFTTSLNRFPHQKTHCYSLSFQAPEKNIAFSGCFQLCLWINWFLTFVNITNHTLSDRKKNLFPEQKMSTCREG